MASYTTKYNLKKPAPSENMNINDINGNMDTIDEQINRSRPLALNKASVSSLPTTITDSRIRSTMICPPGGMRLSNPGAQRNDWTVSTANGSVTIRGVISGSTNIYLWLEEPMT